MYEIVLILYAVVRIFCWRHSSKCKRVQVNKIFSESFRLSDAYINIYIYIYVSERDHSAPSDYMKEYAGPTLSMIDGFPLQRTNNVELGCFFGVSVNRLFNKQSKCRWSETSWISADVTVIGTNFSEIRVKMLNFWLKMHSKMSPAKWRPFCLSLNVL